MILTRHAAVIAGALCILAPALATPAPARPLEVRASPIYLNPDNSSQTSIGRLRYVTGLHLRSEDQEFGGLSGHTLLPDGKTWLAISDEGKWLSGSLDDDAAGTVTGISEVTLDDLLGTDGMPLLRTRNKRFVDAEAIRLTDNGDILVSFEGEHRILRYAAATGLGGAAQLLTPPKVIRTAPRNGGMEAIAALSKDRILALTEDMWDQQGRLVGWLVAGQRWQPLRLRANGLFRPTDMAALPNGDVLLLERRFTLAGGPAARISFLKAKSIAADAVLNSITLAELSLPLSVDNFEALAVRPDGAGGWHLFLLSDDNFNPLQRTLLLQFQLPKSALEQ